MQFFLLPASPPLLKASGEKRRFCTQDSQWCTNVVQNKEISKVIQLKDMNYSNSASSAYLVVMDTKDLLIRHCALHPMTGEWYNKHSETIMVFFVSADHNVYCFSKHMTACFTTVFFPKLSFLRKHFPGWLVFQRTLSQCRHRAYCTLTETPCTFPSLGIRAWTKAEKEKKERKTNIKA